MGNMPKMRTIKEMAALIKESDPNTRLSERSIRALVKTGQLPCVQVGRKILISVEVFEKVLNHITTSENTNKITEPLLKAVNS